VGTVFRQQEILLLLQDIVKGIPFLDTDPKPLPHLVDIDHQLDPKVPTGKVTDTKPSFLMVFCRESGQPVLWGQEA